MIEVRSVCMSYPTLFLSIKQMDKEVVRPGEEGRPLAEIRVEVREIDLIRIEVRCHSGDGFNSPMVTEGANIRRSMLVARALKLSNASITGDRKEITAQIEAFLDHHIGAVRKLQAVN